MRVALQIVAVAVIAALVGGGWYLAFGRDQPMAEQAGFGGGPQAVPVEVAEARLGTVTERAEAVGTTRARESIEVVTEVSGRIAAIHFEEGAQVRRGEVLLELDVLREEAEQREAQARLRDVEKQLERARELLRTRNIPEARVDELEAEAEAARSRVAVVESRIREKRITAPFDGVVGLREVSPGAYVEPQRRITTLDDLDVILIDFAVPERFLGHLRPGLAVEATSAAFDDNRFQGEVARIDTRVDPVTRVVRVQSAFDNEDRRLRPGMFLSVELVLSERDDAVLIPEEAVVFQGGSAHVFVVEEGRARRVEVTLGLRTPGEVEVREGVETGALVVVAGQQRLRDGVPVQLLGDVPTG
jgi:membrane fusion protein, multidrug efflux system